MSTLSLLQHDYPHIGISISGSTYIARTDDGKILATNTDIGALLNAVHPSLVDNDVISFQNGTYGGTTNYTNTNRRFLKFLGNGARITGCKFIIGDVGAASTSPRKQNTLEHFFFNGANAGVVVDNAWNPQLVDCRFDACDEGLSLEATGSYSEFLVLRNVHFNNCKKGLIFKTPTGTGTGSYINSYLDTVTFNSETAWAPGAAYKFIEVQSGAQVNESKWMNLRLWFNCNSQQGIGIDHSGDASRCMLFKPYFENFAGAQNTIGIRINAAANSGFYLVGRPVFSGAGTWAGKFINASNKYIHSPLQVFRITTALSPVGVNASYGTSSTILDTQNFGDMAAMPNLYVYTSGIRADEKITVEITVTTYSALTYTVTKTVQGNGFFPLSLADYTAFASNNFYYVLDTITARGHTNKADTSGITVAVGAMQGGTLVPNPSTEEFRTICAGDQHYTAYRPNNGAGTGCGYFFDMNNSDSLEKTYGRIYGIIDTNTAGAHAGRFRFDLANAGALAERFGIEKDGALTTKSYTDYTKITIPADPSAEIARLYFKQIDASNNGLFVKLKQSGSIVEDAFITAANASTLTNKTIAAASNTISGIVDANINTHTTTKITTTAKGQLNSAIAYNDQANTFGAFDQQFKTSRLIIRNPADTFGYLIAGAAIAANRTVTLPLLPGNDTAVTEAFTQTLTNKTVNTTDNTVTATSQATGDILKNNGTKFVRLARGTGLQVLRVNSGGTDLEYASLDSEKTGKAIASGNASTTIFTIAHTLGAIPSYAFVDCSSHSIARTWTVDGTDITVTFASAPPSGTDNVIIYWRVIA